MKSQVTLARLSSNSAAIFVNKTFVMKATGVGELINLATIAFNLCESLETKLVEFSPPCGSGASWSEIAEMLPIEPQPDTIPVRFWGDYTDDTPPNTHSLEIIDQRKTAGNARIILAANDGGPDEGEVLDVLLEIQDTPFDGKNRVMTALVHVDMDEPVMSITQFDQRLLVRALGHGVELEEDYVEIEGKRERVFWING